MDVSMEPYLIALRSAYIAFPFLAALFTFPYALYEYHKYGAMLVYKIIVVYTFWFYILCLCFLVSLPLPSFEEAMGITDNMVRLEPFAFLNDIRHEALIDVAGWNMETLKAVMKTQTFFEAAANIVMMMPFGIYLHYYFKRNWFEVIILGFFMSLFFEISQITALFGIYPHAYRYFDVDDLICNTFGAFLGVIVTPLFTFFLPKRDKLDKLSYKKGTKVSFLRRLTAQITDFIIMLIVILVVFYSQYKETNGIYENGILLFEAYLLFALVYYCLIPGVLGGYTVGRAICHLKLVDKDGKRPKFYQIFIRNIILYYVVLPAPGYAFLAYILRQLYYPEGIANVILLWAIILFLGISLIYIIDLMLNVFSKDKILLYDRIANTRYVSEIDKDGQLQNNL